MVVHVSLYSFSDASELRLWRKQLPEIVDELHIGYD